MVKTFPLLSYLFRYYKRSDLDFKKLTILKEDERFIGDNEVFPTNHHDKVFVDCIVGRCKVYTI
jgi:hypothetical protein